MKKKAAFLFLYVAEVICTVTSVLITSSSFSCRLTQEGISVVDLDKSFPEVKQMVVKGEDSIYISCSKEFLISDIEIRKVLNEEELSFLTGDEIKTEYGEDKTGVLISLGRKTEIGCKYVFSSYIRDKKGNTLYYEHQFTGFNVNPATLIISEIRSTMSKQKVEFVELYCVKEGNTSGLSVVSGYYGYDKKYDLPVMNVSKGEYITVHYRTLSDVDGCISETGTDLGLSYAQDSCDKARDLWFDNTNKLLTKSDVLAVFNQSGETYMDCVLYSESSKTQWTKDYQKKLASILSDCGVWSGSTEPADVVKSDNMTVTQTLSRQNINSYNGKSCRDDFFVTARGKASPGEINSNIPYIPDI